MGIAWRPVPSRGPRTGAGFGSRDVLFCLLWWTSAGACTLQCAGFFYRLSQDGVLGNRCQRGRCQGSRVRKRRRGPGKGLPRGRSRSFAGAVRSGFSHGGG